MNIFFLSEVCGKCGESLSRSQPAVRAMDKLFHSHCFCCVTCRRPLQSMQFYDRDGTPQCEDCYMVRHVKWHICGLHFLESEKQSYALLSTWHTSLMWELVLFSDIVHPFCSLKRSIVFLTLCVCRILCLCVPAVGSGSQIVSWKRWVSVSMPTVSSALPAAAPWRALHSSPMTITTHTVSKITIGEPSPNHRPVTALSYTLEQLN